MATNLEDRLTDQVEQEIANTRIAQDWLNTFGTAMQNQDADAAAGCFLEQGWLRDLLALSWDLRTFHGIQTIAKGLGEFLPRAKPRDFRLQRDKTSERVQADPETEWLQAFYEFETETGHCCGFFRLMPDGEGGWKAWTLVTALEDLKSFEAPLGANRPRGVIHGAQRDRENWLDRRRKDREYTERDPQVLVIGAGQAGLTIGARLGQLGVGTLLIDRNERVGDNWRKRYHSLVLHDPVWYDHMPYLPFPQHWPVFTPKDKLADWFEHYVSALELNVWTQTELLDAQYDGTRWTVRLRRGDGSEKTVKPNHIVMATGLSGLPQIPDIPGMADFQGTLVHSSEHAGGAAWAGKNAVVIGTGNSGHDIAHEFREYDANTTMVQRSPTYIMSSKHGVTALFSGFYEQDGPPTEDADLMFASIPYPLVAQLHQGTTRAVAELDAPLLEGLENAGFQLGYGEDGSGLFMLYLRRGGGYYIDVGCSQLIADGKIAIKQGDGIRRITADSIEFNDGSSLRADVIVLATGYTNMREKARALLGDQIADQVKPIWGLDDEGELRTIWRESGHPGLWFMGGNLHQCRHYSRFLALQIKAREEGISTSRD